MIEAVLSGLVFGLSLIVAIGAQNLFVLRQGLHREHVLAVVSICTVSDAALIAAGVAGASLALGHHHDWLEAVHVIGATFLFSYAAVAARRMWSGRTLNSPAVARPRLLLVVLSCLAFTFLNPAVYLDTVVLVGSIASTYVKRQWDFAAGAILASVLWFSALGYGARLFAPLFRRRRSLQVLDAFTVVVMVAIGCRVLLSR